MKTEQTKMTPEEIESAGWGWVLILLTLGVIVTTVMIFFGGDWYWPCLFFIGLVMNWFSASKRARN